MLEVGIKAPDFELPDQNGKTHRLSDYTGKKVILYFYPKDNTAAVSYTHLQIYSSHRKWSLRTGSSSAVKQTRPQRNCI